MLHFPSSPIVEWQRNFPATPGAASFTTITGGAANTKGSYSTLIATATYDSYGFWLGIFNSGASTLNTSQLLDIALGAAASEVDIFSNYLTGQRPINSTSGGPYWLFVPLFIPAGARVSARLQGVIASDTVNVAIVLAGGQAALNGRIYTGCDTYGAVTATSTGTAHTPGNTGAESAAATIGTATRDYSAVLLGLGSTQTVMTTIDYHVELTIGGVTLAEWYTAYTTNEVIVGPSPQEAVRAAIANGAAMQVQAEASGTAQAITVIFHCFY